MPPKADPLAEYRAKRDATRTPEPAGLVGGRASPAGVLRFVVHKHAARRLHWDLRLEVDGVLWSWAVPGGPSRDPAEKRLAVHTEDHPIEYFDFEDVIPEGNYGAGAMIAWDQGTYVPLHPMHEGLAAGKLLFELRGHKLRGTWTLVKLRKAEEDAWLLIKERDATAVSGPDDFPEDSVLSGLTVEELASGHDPAERVREELRRAKAPIRVVDPTRTPLMLAESADTPFSRAGWIFEFKYDGYRTLAYREDDDIRLISRRGNDMSSTFPDLVRALGRLPFRRFILDGEIVVDDAAGIPSFQRLQQRGQLRRPIDIRRAELSLPAKLWLFDLIAFEDLDARPLPLVRRKEILRGMLPTVGTLRYSDHVEQVGEALYEQAVRIGLEGVIGKRADAPYRSGRSADWIKVRALRTEDFVVVGWTAPKGGRTGFGALYLAEYQGNDLRFVGQVGSGFTDRQIRDIHRRLEAGRVDGPPCGGAPQAKGSSWTRPEMVCEVRYLERTDEGLLRQPVFVRMRDDKDPRECVGRVEDQLDDEPPIVAAAKEALATDSSIGDAATNARSSTDVSLPDEVTADPSPASRRSRRSSAGRPSAKPSAGAADTSEGQDSVATPVPDRDGSRRPPRPTRSRGATKKPPSRGSRPVDALVPLDSSRPIHFTNLDKVLWPEDGYTKGDLITYYRAISPWMLPFLRDRPLVLTRFPDGIHGKSFFQKDAPSFAPGWLRTEELPDEDDEGKTPSYFIGDDVETLLYVANAASIPLHVWSSRVSTVERPDWCILDLDPKEAPFAHVIEVALAAKALCDECGLPVYVKTSGSSGIHLLVPLGGLLDHEQSKSFGELLARVLVRDLGSIATITRQVGRRGGKVYVDYLQNGRGKLLVAPYCVRPLPGAPVSTPLHWPEVEPGLDIRAFTIRTVLERVAKMEDDPLLPVLSERPDLLSALEALQGRV